MMEIVIKYMPHEKQLMFHESHAKYRLFNGGVGSGKTVCGVNELLKACMESNPGAWYGMAAPTFKMLSNVTVREFLHYCPKKLIRKYNKSEQIIELINGVGIIGIAGDREDTIDRARGLSLAGVYGDEIARSSEYMHEVLVGRIRDARGNMKIWYTTTPKGFNWLYRMFVEKKNKKGDPLADPENYEVITGSSLENPYTPEEYKQALINTYVGAFAKQEISGEFVGWEGLVYQEFSRQVHVTDTSKIEFKEIIIGVDFGFKNPSTMIKIGFDHDGRAYVMDEFYRTETTDQDLAKIAADTFGKERYIADSANPSGIEEFRRAGLNCKGVEKKQGENRDAFVQAGIKKLSSLIHIQADGKPRFFVDKKCVNTIMEFENYRYPDQKDDHPVQENPIKLFDHALDSIRYVIYSKEKKFAFAFG